MRRPALGLALPSAALAALATILCACGGGGYKSPAPTLYVTTLADDGPGSLRQAVFDAPPGATVAFDPSVAGGIVTLDSAISVGKDLLIDGSTPAGDITIDGNKTVRLFDTGAPGDVSLRHLILRRGESTGDGGIIAAEDGSLRLDHVSLLDGLACGSGGAIYALSCDLEMVDCHVQGCIAENGGGLYLHWGSLRLLQSSIVLNAATNGDGGGLTLYGATGIVRNCTSDTNLATGAGPGPFHGGAIAALGGPLGMVELGVYGCTFSDNEADTFGGGV